MSADMPFTDAALKNQTGKDWQEWKVALERWGAAEQSHPEIAKYISEEFGYNGWWSQGITVGYERMIARRAVGQMNDGSYSASVSKTINANINRVHSALVVELTRLQWLDGSVVRLRTSMAPKSARFDDHEANVIIAFFLTEKGDEKTSVQVEATKFPTKESGDEWKAAWRPRLAKLAEYLANTQNR